MITIEAPRTTAGGNLPGAPTSPSRLALCSMRVVPELRRFARQPAGRRRLPGAVEALSLVVTVPVTHVLLHSSSPNVALLPVLDGPTVTAQVADDGRWKPPRTRRTEAAAAGGCHARALRRVEAYAAHCTVFTGRVGIRVSAVFPAGGFPKSRAAAAT